MLNNIATKITKLFPKWNYWSLFYNDNDPNDHNPDDNPDGDSCNSKSKTVEITRDSDQCTWYNSAYWRYNAAIFGHFASNTTENLGVDKQQEVKSEDDQQEVRSNDKTKECRAGYHKNKFYIDSGASLSHIFNLGWIQNLILTSK